MWADGVYDDPDWDQNSFQRTRDLTAANHTMPELRADRVDIAAFLAAGGKALIYQVGLTLRRTRIRRSTTTPGSRRRTAVWRR
jgi:hypothetical protein